MRYRFIGENGSMGYITGKVYHGTLETRSSVERSVLFIPGVFPFNVFSKRYVIPYSTIEKFYENWQQV